MVLGLAALFGTMISTSLAQILKYPKYAIQNGLYGFNGTLTGIAILFFFDINLITIMASVIGSAMSTILMHYLIKVIPPFTAPFVIASWFVMFLLVFTFNLSVLPSTEPTVVTFNFLSALSHGFGQVMFQENVITGILFLCAIIINNKLMAIYAVYAAILSAFVAWLFSQPLTAINAGLMGYNAILCAIALSGKKWNDVLWVTMAITLSTFLNIGMALTGIITLTAPFVIITWFIMTMKNIQNKRNRIPKFI